MWPNPWLSLQVGTNVGLAWEWATDEQAAVGEVEYTLALGYNVTETLYAYVEGFGAGRQVAWGRWPRLAAGSLESI